MRWLMASMLEHNILCMKGKMSFPIFSSRMSPGQTFCLVFLLLTMTVSRLAWALEDTPQELDWEALIPPGWNPAEPFERYTDVEIERMSEEEISLLEAESQMIFDAAPAVDTLNGQQARMPGFLLPLEFDGEQVSEFLLVPYLGACIHTPPPPANQIIYGTYEPGYAIDDLYTPVWITGELKVNRVNSKLSETGFDQILDVTSGYVMRVDEIVPYVEPAQ